MSGSHRFVAPAVVAPALIAPSTSLGGPGAEAWGWHDGNDVWSDLRHALSHTRIIVCTHGHTHAGFFSHSLFSLPLLGSPWGLWSLQGVFLTHSHKDYSSHDNLFPDRFLLLFFFSFTSSYIIRLCRWRFHDACFISFTTSFTMRTRWIIVLPHPSPHFFFSIYLPHAVCVIRF